MDDELSRRALAEILEEMADEGAHDLGEPTYPVIEPRSLAMFCLRDCEEQLQRAKAEPLRLALAAKSVHLALQASLIEALAGAAGVGAYSDKLRADYLAYFEDTRAGLAPMPESDRVMSFNNLLAKAMEHPLEWSGHKLEVSEEQLEALKRLTTVRDRIEHTRPGAFIIEPPFVTLTIPIAAKLTFELLDVPSHRYNEGERTSVDATVSAITKLCAQMD